MSERKAPWIGIIADIIIPVPTTSRCITRNFLVLELYKLQDIFLSEIRARNKRKKWNGREKRKTVWNRVEVAVENTWNILSAVIRGYRYLQILSVAFINQQKRKTWGGNPLISLKSESLAWEYVTVKELIWKKLERNERVSSLYFKSYDFHTNKDVISVSNYCAMLIIDVMQFPILQSLKWKELMRGMKDRRRKTSRTAVL